MTTPKGDEPPKSQVPNTQSLKPVAASATTVKDPDEGITKAEEKELEKLLGNESEVDDDADIAKPAMTGHPMEAVAKRLKQLVTLIPKETPDDHRLWGAAGIVLTLGDLRTIVKQLR